MPYLPPELKEPLPILTLFSLSYARGTLGSARSHTVDTKKAEVYLRRREMYRLYVNRLSVSEVLALLLRVRSTGVAIAERGV